MRTLVISLLLTILAPINISSMPYNIFGMDYTYHTFNNIILPFDANIINTMYQDKQGMIWLGTKRGLFNYNGYNTNKFENKEGTGWNTIQTIIQYGSHYLCIGTDNGIVFFNLYTEQFENAGPQLSKVKAIRSLRIWNNRLWIGSRDDGLFYYDINKKILRHSICHGTKGTIVFALEEAKNNLYIGTHEGLFYIKAHSDKQLPIKIEKSNNNKNDIIYSILYDNVSKCLWIGSDGELIKYELGNDQKETIDDLSNNVIKTIAKDNKNNILIGTDAGLFIYNKIFKKTDHIVHDSRTPKSLCNNVILNILFDNNSNAWFATDRGLSMTQMKPWYKTVLLPEITNNGNGNIFTQIFIDSKKEYWLSGENGIIHIKPDTNEDNVDWFRSDNKSHHLLHNNIRCIYEDRDHDLWITSDESIARYDRNTDKFIYYYISDSKGHHANWAYAIYEDSKQRLWIGTYMGGLFVINKKKLLNSGGRYVQKESYFKGYENIVSTVYKIEPDDNGLLWLNTSKGLASVNPRTMRISLKNIYMDNMLYSNNAIFIADQGKLFKYEITSGKKLRLPFSTDGGMIYSLVKENNNVWFSTANGVYYIDTKTNKIHMSFVPENQYFSGIYDKNKNEIIWGGEDKITNFSINEVKNISKSRHVYITGILQNGEIINSYEEKKGCSRFTNKIELKTDKNIILELSSYSYSTRNQEVFYYKFDKDDKWHSLQKGQNQLSFTTLAYGKHHIFLSNTDPDYDKSAIISIYTITVPYPWYLSWWTIVFYIVLICGTIGIIIRYSQIQNKKKYEHKEREKTLELSKQKMDFFVNVSHELKTPLSLIIAPLSKLISETSNNKQRESLKSIHKNSLKLNNLINKILDFKRMEYESEDSILRSYVEFNGLITNCINNFKSIKESRHIDILFKSNVENYG